MKVDIKRSAIYAYAKLKKKSKLENFLVMPVTSYFMS